MTNNAFKDLLELQSGSNARVQRVGLFGSIHHDDNPSDVDVVVEASEDQFDAIQSFFSQPCRAFPLTDIDFHGYKIRTEPEEFGYHVLVLSSDDEVASFYAKNESDVTYV